MTKDITFSLPAEAMQGASEAVVLGDFNNWNPQHAPKLVKQEDGSFSVAVPLQEGETYRYRFLLDNKIWVNDYNAQRYEPAPGLNIDNCVITVPESPAEENSNEVIVAPKRAIKKATKVKREEASADASVKSVAAKTPKKAGSKAKTTKDKGEKKAKNKVAGDKLSTIEKPLEDASPKSVE
jgi:hypothetical protein